ncbi:alpha/beta-hydrolase [Meredithblackwellia eburnea MCA 4105]
MPKENVEFKTLDGVTLRGWYFKAAGSGKSPAIVMAHGWSATKEFDLELFAEVFQAAGMHVLVYDHRGFGDSDTAPHAPRLEIVPSEQLSDWSDAITYVQAKEEVDPKKIGVWGSSYSGGHVLQLGATDKRIKAVSSQVPFVSGIGNFRSLIRSDFVPTMYEAFEKDRQARAKGDQAGMLPVVDPDPMAPSSLPTADSWEFFNRVGHEGKAKGKWHNQVTVRSVELFKGYEPGRYIDLISPVPLLMTVAEADLLTPTHLALEVFSHAKEPKQLNIIKGAGHFEAYAGKYFEQNSQTQLAFFKKALLE